MKTWAFYKNGEEWHRIGLYAVLAREKVEPNLWRRRTYYSTHSPSNIRLKTNIRQSSKGTFSFAYNPGQEAEVARLGGGETLIYYLYKIAISELMIITVCVIFFLYSSGFFICEKIRRSVRPKIINP